MNNTFRNRLRINKLCSIAVAVFWVLQVNPAAIWTMSISSGYGYGSIRSGCYMLGIVFLGCVGLFQLIVRNGLNFPVINQVLRLLGLFAFVIIVRILLDLITYEQLDYAGLFPFVEFIFSAFIFSTINVYQWINININRIKLVAVVFMLVDLCLWGYSILSGVSYGVFRANINGLEINRMPDLFYAGVASFILVDKESKFICRGISFVTILVTLYRTAYLASLAAIVYYLYKNRRKVNFLLFFKQCSYTLISVAFFLAIIGAFLFSDFSLLDVLIDRVYSTFQAESDVYGEGSKSQRIDQIVPLLDAIWDNALFGSGFGYYLLGEPIYNYFNYILIAFVIIGFPLLCAIPFVRYLFIKVVKIDGSCINEGTHFVNTMVVYFFVLLNVFPYMAYFPIGSVFAFAICYHLWARSIYHANDT